MGLRLREPGTTPLRDAAQLLPVAAIEPNGLVVTTEGALVRILHVSPPNPLILSDEDRAQAAAGFAHLIGRLRSEQSLQYYVQSRPINLEELLAASRREVALWAGPPPTMDTVVEPRARDRWRLYGAMEESIRLHADHQAAVAFDAYLVVPFVPRDAASVRAIVAQFRRGREKLPSAAVQRDLESHRRVVRKALAHVDALRAELDAMSIPNRVLEGVEVAELLFSRFNPTIADRGARPLGEALSDLDSVVSSDRARAAARRLREQLARSAIDFASDPGHATIDRDLEQTIYCANTVETTYFGWLMLAMMTCRQPFTMSVFVHALDRRRERQRLKMSYRRTFAVNRQSESKGHVPDFDRYFAENEHQQLLTEMSGQDRAAIYRVSVYQSIRARGPEPDASALAEAVDHAAEHLSSAADCRVDHGKFQQSLLWQSTLPLGRDVADRSRRYVTRNAGDTTPLLGVAVGSPSGIPFAYTEPGRTLEKFNPYDRTHANHLCLVTGRSGAGKTLLCNVLLARSLAHGARGFVIDRAGHYRVLTNLIAGAQHIDIGADDSEFHLNPWDTEDLLVTREKVAFLIGLHQTMMEEGLTTLERAQLGAAIRGVYERAAATGEPPRESLLKDELERRAEAELASGSADMAFILRNLAERIAEYCGNGAYAHIADEPSTHVPDSPLLVFDTRRCPEAVLKPVIFTVLEFVTRTVERHRDSHRELAARTDAPLFAGRSVMLGDEFWSVVANPELGGYANDLARRSRHLGLTMIVATQQLSDFDNEYGLALLRNSTIQVFLSQHREELDFVQRALGLSDSEIDLISRLKTVKGSYSQVFWVNGTRGRGQVSLRVGPMELWAFTSDPVRDVPLRDQKIAEHDGDVWRAIADLAGRRPGHANTGFGDLDGWPSTAV